MVNDPEERDRLRDSIEREARRIDRARRERHAWLAHTTYIGTLGLVMVLPIVVGAYVGRWLDERLAGYSVDWTISLICIGIAIGALNVYFLIRDTDGRW